MVTVKDIKEALLEAKDLYPYKVCGERETYSCYNEGWQDCINFIDFVTGILDDDLGGDEE